MSLAGGRCFEKREDGVLRTWQVCLSDRSVELSWGVAGVAASRLVKELPSEGKARAEYERLIRQRLGMGYREVGGDGPAGDRGS